MPPEFHLVRPWWLLALLPLALLLWHLARSRGDGEAWRRLVDAHLLPGLLVDTGGASRRLPLALLGLGWMLLTLALAGPTWTRLPQPIYQAQQYRVIALDLSPSMNAADRVPSRLAQARFEVLDLLRRHAEGQTALLAYGPEPFVVSPLTSDVATIALQVPALQTDLLPQPGTRRTDLALQEAGRLLQQAGAPRGEVILVTDGVADPAQANTVARRLLDDGYRVSVLGVGTAQGAPVERPAGGFLRDAAGAILVAKLNEPVLRALADAGGGLYVAATAGDSDIAALAPERAGAAPPGGQQTALTEADQWREEGPWLLLLLLPLAALAFRRGWLSPLLLLVVLIPARDSYALSWDELWSRPDQRAMQQFDQGEAAAAAQLFGRPDWQAAAHYRAGDYAAALAALQGLDGADAEYNRGNALARAGRLEEALAAYDRALQQDPGNPDARHNRDLVARLLQQQRAQQDRSQVDNPDSAEQQQQPDAENQEQEGTEGEQPDPAGQDRQQQQQPGPGEQQDAGEAQQEGQAEADGAQRQPGEKGGHPPQSPPNPGAGEQQPTPQEQAQRDDAQGQEEGEAQDGAAAGPPQAADATGQGEQPAEAQDPGQTSMPSRQDPGEPGVADLLQQNPQGQGGTAPPLNRAPVDPEKQQAMEQMLRRVPDDPGGLLRQRFWLQHLRRQGRLPGGE